MVRSTTKWLLLALLGGPLTVTDPEPVCADEDRLLQIVSNLVENALRCTPAGGEITIEIRGRAIAVRDTGPGLDQDDVGHAFDRFYAQKLGVAAVLKVGADGTVSATPVMRARLTMEGPIQ